MRNDYLLVPLGARMLKKYCDACDVEIDASTIRPRIEISIYSPTDGSRLNHWELCDGCLITMQTWLRGFMQVRGRLQEPRT